MRINMLKQGSRAQIVGYEPGNPGYRQKLLSMGLTPGTVFMLSRIAPLGDPVQIELRGYTLSLRKDEAMILKIKQIEQ